MNGSDRVVQDLKDDIFKIRTLQECSYYQDGMDKCRAIRDKAKDLVELVQDPRMIEQVGLALNSRKSQSKERVKITECIRARRTTVMRIIRKIIAQSQIKVMLVVLALKVTPFI